MKKPRKKKTTTNSNKEEIRLQEIKIDDWNAICSQFANVAHLFMDCEHDYKPIRDFLSTIYAHGFGHGLSRAIEPKYGKQIIKLYKYPRQNILKTIEKLCTDRLLSHPRQDVPKEERN